MRLPILLVLSLLFFRNFTNGQSCTPQGNQSSYGTNNVWIGYVYDNSNFTTYKGYINEGTSANPNFDENFGGDNTSFTTHGCNVQTETFSVRYKLTKTFTSGMYQFIVGGDDGYRLSLDGGSTWVINSWSDHPYSTTTYQASLSGSYNMVLEYYENGGSNRISFSVGSSSAGTENTSVYGTNNVWRGYVYDGTAFNIYAGMVTEGTAADPSFNEDFGGSDVMYPTSGTTLQTETFSVRYRLTKTFNNGSYTFFVGGDDGYRLSLDGGSTWVIDKWWDQSYNLSSYTIALNGTYNMVIEFYENGGDNRISFAYQFQAALAIDLLSFAGTGDNKQALLSWEISASSDPDYFELEKSVDGFNFLKIKTINGNEGRNTGTAVAYTYTDASVLPGKSQYRLKMIDQSGKITYSKTITITINNTGKNEIKVFPSVITSGKSININTSNALNNATVSFIDLAGKTIMTKQYGRLLAGQTINFPLETVQTPAGIYLVSISDNDKPVVSKKIVIQ